MKTKKQKPVPEELRRWRYEDKLSEREIARKTGYSCGTVHYWLTNLDSPRTGNVSRSPSRDELDRLYYDKNKNAKEIGKIYGVSGSVVTKWLRREKIRIKTKSEVHLCEKTRPTQEELYNLYQEQKLSSVAISSRYNVSDFTIRSWLKVYGIPIRTKFQPERTSDNEINSSLLEIYVGGNKNEK